MASLLDLARRMDALQAEAATMGSLRAVAAAKAILRELVYGTPVDTSQALSNWQIGIGEPVASARPAYFFGERGSTRNASASAAYAEGVQKLSTKLPGETVYISNLTDYIIKLNEGSSRQAPAGFVERAVIVGREAAKRPEAE